MTFRYLFAILLFTSCSLTQELSEQFKTLKNNTSSKNTNVSFEKKWSFTDEEIVQMKQKAEIKSEAYQKLLIKAIEEKDIPQIKKYVSMGANPNAGILGSSEFSNSPAIVAIKKNCKDCLKAMLPKLDINFSNRGYWTLPLGVACNTSLDWCKEVVLEYNAIPNAFAFNKTANYSKYKSTAFRGVVENPKKGVIPFLLEQGAKHSIGYSQAWYNFMSGSKNRRIEDIEAFLKAGATPNFYIYGSSQHTVLGKAIHQGRNDIVKLLLDYGADPNLINKGYNSSTALYFAIKKNNYDTVKLLISKDANVNEINYDKNGNSNLTGLNYALSIGNIDQRIIDLLIESGGR